MNPLRVIIRIDAFSEVGSGHFYRCFEIAKKLAKKNFLVEFVGEIQSLKLRQKLKKRNFLHHKLKLSAEVKLLNNNEYLPYSNKLQIEDVNNTLSFMNQKYDLVIVDNYKLDHIWEKRILKKTKKIMVIDDLSNRKHCCDLLLDQTIEKTDDNYKKYVNSNCKLLVGQEFFLLREEFLEMRNNSQSITEKNSSFNALVSFGGDNHELTIQVCKQLMKIKEITNFDVVLGPLTSSDKELHLFKSDNRFNVIYNTDKMAELLVQCDFAVGASGGSTWERLYLQVPSFQFIVSENQKEISEKLEKSNYVKVIGNLSNLVPEVEKWIDRELIFRKFDHIDGFGTNRVIKELEKILS